MTSTLQRNEITLDSHTVQALFTHTIRQLANNQLNVRVLGSPTHAGKAFARAQLCAALLDPSAEASTFRESAKLLRLEDYSLLLSSPAPSPSSFTDERAMELAKHFMIEAWQQRLALTPLPDRILTAAEFETEASIPILLQSAMALAANARVLTSYRQAVLASRADLMVAEGATEPDVIFAEIFNEGIWA